MKKCNLLEHRGPLDLPRYGQITWTIARVFLLAIGTVTSNASWAGAIVTADIRTSAPFAALGNTGKTELRAHSQEFGQTNADFFTDTTSGGVVINPAPKGAISSNVRNISVKGKKNAVTRYVPVVGLADQPKANIKQVGDIESLVSLTGTYVGTGNQFQNAKGRYLAALAFNTFSPVGPPPPGAAAGAAYDPITIPGGSVLSYAPQVDAALQLGNPSFSGGLDIYVVDSTVLMDDNVANFLADGSPFEQTLWHLNLSADKPLNGISDVAVDFQLNPLGLKEILVPNSYLSSLPGYSAALGDSEVALLLEQAIDTAVIGALKFLGGTVSLPAFPIFPEGTLFRTTGNIEYAEGVDAGLAGIPGPGGITILTTALVGFFGSLCWRWRG